MKKTPAEIGELPLDDFVGLVAWYENHSPHRRDDLRFASLMALVANLATKDGGYTVDDFLPGQRKEERSASDPQVEREMMMWCLACGGQVKNGD